MGEWDYSLFGCFDHCGLCLTAYFLPCVIAGRNAEMAGVGNCCTCGFVSMLGVCGLYYMAKTREATREKFGIEGSFVEDCLWTWVCPLCSLIQINRQFDGVGQAGQSMARV